MKHKQVSDPKRGTQKRGRAYGVLGVIALMTIAGLLITRSFFTNEEAVEAVTALATETHFHGIAIDPKEPSRLYLATHHGLFVVDGAGQARLVSETLDDFMGFTPHPIDPAILYASGHPAGGGNTGFIASDDGGRTWRKLSDGAGGPVDFHQMDVSVADSKVIYGVYGDIQKSTDGGQSWKIIAPAPMGLIDLAAGISPNTLYAATRQGLLRSTDDGKSWTPAYRSPQPFRVAPARSDFGQGIQHADAGAPGNLAAAAGTRNCRECEPLDLDQSF